MALFQQGMTLKSLLENPDLLNPPRLMGDPSKDKKEKDPDGIEHIFNPQSAFLGPQLWDKTLPYDSNDLKLEYMDLDEFLQENGIPLTDDQSKSNLGEPKVTVVQQSPPQLLGVTVNPTTLSPTPKAFDDSHLSDLDTTNSSVRELTVCPSPDSPSSEFPLNPEDLALARIPGQEEFDPRRRKFSVEELRPQPMIKKAKKTFVHDEAKDEKYWSRRNKNNVAAKRSRDARRIKENQIALRAAFLEKQTENLKVELALSKEENSELRKRLAKYE